jgi:hypothetical protein
VGIKSGICACNKNESKNILLWGIKKRNKNQSNASHVRQKVVIYNKRRLPREQKSKRAEAAASDPTDTKSKEPPDLVVNF